MRWWAMVTDRLRVDVTSDPRRREELQLTVDGVGGQQALQVGKPDEPLGSVQRRALVGGLQLASCSPWLHS